MKYLSTGDFAKLCGTTKDTLFFYDKEGLLKPRYVLENGYRRYGLEQYYDYDMITMFKETGSSLKEIRQHMNEKDPERFLALFEEKKRLLKAEREKLDRRKKVLDDIIRLTREALNTPFDVLEFVTMPAEVLELVPAGPKDYTTVEGSVALFVEFVDYFERQGRTPFAPYGFLVTQEDVLAQRYITRNFFAGATKTTHPSHRRHKTEGVYAVLLHLGTLESHKRAYKKMLADINRQGKRIAGDMYACDQMSYVMARSPDEYAMKYCVPVE